MTMQEVPMQTMEQVPMMQEVILEPMLETPIFGQIAPLTVPLATTSTLIPSYSAAAVQPGYTTYAAPQYSSYAQAPMYAQAPQYVQAAPQYTTQYAAPAMYMQEPATMAMAMPQTYAGGSYALQQPQYAAMPTYTTMPPITGAATTYAGQPVIYEQQPVIYEQQGITMEVAPQ